MEKLCNLSGVFYGEKMVKLITKMVSMDTVVRVILLWRFYGKINLEMVWGFEGETMINE